MKYSCDNHRPIYSKDLALHPEGAMGVGEIFAGRKARAEFGRRGHVRACRVDSFSTDGRVERYEAFIGVPGHGIDRSATVGHNVFFSVKVEGEGDETSD